MLRFMPSFHCEKKKSHAPFREYNEGVRLDFETISKDEEKIARVYYDYEVLSSGPVHEFGMAMDMKF